MNITVTLYCKPYVARWLQLQYGNTEKPEQPLKLPRKSAFKYSFLNSLSKKFHASRDYNISTYPSAVNFQLHVNDQVQHGTSIQPQLHNFINHTIEENLKNQLFIYIYSHCIKGVTVDKAIQLYQTNFGFTDDVFSTSAIQSAYFRRKELFENIFCGTASTKF